MTDYGHDLVFGSFLTPTSADPARVVALARHSEQVGLDLVTVQDHPYHPGLLDAWTLLSYLAAATGTVSLAPNVINLPLRPPAVLARSAAGLDLLSGGRVELGLGAGAFWDAIGAMGGPRRAPGEAVDALAEAITVIRELWAADVRGGVRSDGPAYPLDGAKRGPAPAHPISIWLGAYGFRMLRLTGSTADGWLPSAAYLAPDKVADANAVIDEAATGAGRDPAEVRRLYNISGQFGSRTDGFLVGPVGQWVDQLTGLALELGISAFILGSDDADDLARFGQEVAPAVREAVLAGRTPTDLRSPSSSQGSAPAIVATQANPSFTVVPTPDDGSRLTRERPLDESTRPSGPAPDPDRVYSPHELASGQHLVDIHDHLRHELVQIRDLVAQVLTNEVDVPAARAEINQMALRQNRWTVGANCAAYNYLLTTHHTIEDQAVFPRLRQADPGLGPVLDRLGEEHHVIHGVLDRVDAALVSFVGTRDGAALRHATDLLSDALLSHLSYEERELVEPLARTMLFSR